MNIVKYQTGIINVPQKMEYTPQINEIGETSKEAIYKILEFYLKQNGKEISFTKSGVLILVERIFNDFGFLELQEVEYILSCGVTGKYGQIFGNITLDLIIPWVQKYCESERRERPEPKAKEQEPVLTGKEISESEFLFTNPEYFKKKQFAEITERAMQYKMAFTDIGKIYSLYLNGCEYLTDILGLIKSYEIESNELKESVSFSLYAVNFYQKQIKAKSRKTA
jgi:hypothetical protein